MLFGKYMSCNLLSRLYRNLSVSIKFLGNIPSSSIYLHVPSIAVGSYALGQVKLHSQTHGHGQANSIVDTSLSKIIFSTAITHQHLNDLQLARSRAKHLCSMNHLEGI